MRGAAQYSVRYLAGIPGLYLLDARSHPLPLVTAENPPNDTKCRPCLGAAGRKIIPIRKPPTETEAEKEAIALLFFMAWGEWKVFF